MGVVIHVFILNRVPVLEKGGCVLMIRGSVASNYPERYIKPTTMTTTKENYVRTKLVKNGLNLHTRPY
jgi:hypothetical protein